MLGGPGARTSGPSTASGVIEPVPSDWREVPASDRLWATERDGDVVLTTTGDGKFVRVVRGSPP